LIDALEDAAFDQVHELNGNGSYVSLFQRASNRNALQKLKEALSEFRVRIVLTAHPTQFYPGAVLGIISDIDTAIRGNKLLDIERYLENTRGNSILQ
jgi:phosphoenolpyruvate carboxylase